MPEDGEEFIKQIKEIEIMCRCQHENVARIFGHWLADGPVPCGRKSLNIAMELCRCDLHDMIRSPKFRKHWNTLLFYSILAGITRGMEYIQSYGIGAWMLLRWHS